MLTLVESSVRRRFFVSLILLLLALALSPVSPAWADHTPEPTSVTIAGSMQSELGCPGDWQPECTTTYLTYDEADDVWQETFTIPAGDWEYKAALNDNWDENYGANAQQNGPNIPLSLADQTDVKFYYDHDTHWVTDNVNSVIATVPGSFQDEIGCPGDWQPDCLRSWLQDPDGDGIYTFTTTEIPAGTYEAKVAINESWDENYGAGGEPNGPNIPFTVPEDGDAIYFEYDPVSHILTIETGAPTGNLATATAHWVSEDTIAWNVPGGSEHRYFLHYDSEGNLSIESGGIVGGQQWELTYDPTGLAPEIVEEFPHLADYFALELPPEALSMVPTLLKGQVAVSAVDDDGDLVDATSLQIPGVLDDLYTYNGELGIIWDGETPTLRVWAPTAKEVAFLLFDTADPEAEPERYEMEYDPATGVWSVTGTPKWDRKFYLYEVTVFVRQTQQVEVNQVTDPYSHSLSIDSRRSQIVDLSDDDLKPAGWDSLDKPALESFEDIVIYELHIRDFSVNDPSVSPENKGKFTAFTETESHGMQHLREIAAAGLTHLHMLPLFDIATIPEDPADREDISWDVLDDYPPDSPEQQALIGEIRDQDAFNWGYDPYHYTVPEGSYSTDPNGVQRIIEFRQMVQALNQNNLRLVMDVVYNHTHAAGQAERSVLDRIVPGYYHRLDAFGTVTMSTCCPNTATEHNMMEKLMIDSLVTWATAYKVDGFRFDLMGHHMKENMLNVRAALNSLTVPDDGVEGSKIYVYGEGWDFGEVANNARGINATQLNMAGTGIGTFNDRLRDAVRGGGPFSDPQLQGFITGLYYDPNATEPGTTQEQLEKLLLYQDQIRVGLAGNLADYTFVSRTGEVVSGAEVPYGDFPAGYTEDPQENIIYISAHDNQTLFDAIQLKMPVDAPMDERVRVQNVGLSVVALGQGVSFYHAGSDMLRSKSMDNDSYNSGDWFNKLDFTYQHNNWGVGLPPAWVESNEQQWPIMAPLLANPALQPQPEDILKTVVHFREMLEISKSSELFQLETAPDVQQMVNFHNTGPDQIPGLIVMSISDEGEVDIDETYELIAVLFNANDEAQSFFAGAFEGRDLVLHPIQQASNDPVVQDSTFDPASATFTVPARTTAVFVEAEEPTAITLGELESAQTVPLLWPSLFLLTAATLGLFALKGARRRS